MANSEKNKVKFEVGDDEDKSESERMETKQSESRLDGDEEKTPINSPLARDNRQQSPARLKYGSSLSDHCLSPKRQLFQPRLMYSMSTKRNSQTDFSESVVQVIKFCFLLHCFNWDVCLFCKKLLMNGFVNKLQKCPINVRD